MLIRILTASILGLIGASIVPFLSIEVYKMLLNLGADNHEILIRLSSKSQTPAEFFALSTVLFGAILGVSSGYIFALQREQKWREIWILSNICGLFAGLFLYGILTHPLYVLLRKERADSLPLAITLFLVPALWSCALLVWGHKVYGARELTAKQWNRKQIIQGSAFAFFYILVMAILDS